MAVERGTLYFVDEKRNEIWSKFADGLEEIRLPIRKGPAGTVAASGEPVMLHDAYSDPRFDQSQDWRTGYRTRSMLRVAIHNRDRRIVGGLQLLDRRQGSFGSRDIEFPGGDLAIADVSGNGGASAMIMSSMQFALRVAALMETNLVSLMTRLNALLYRMASGRKYVTFFFARYTPSTGEMRYVNAGHNPPFLVAGHKLEQLGSTGRPIGILPESPYQEARAMLPPGSTLFLYTDGLNEANNPGEHELRMDRLEKVIADSSREEIERMADAVLESVGVRERRPRLGRQGHRRAAPATVPSRILSGSRFMELGGDLDAYDETRESLVGQKSAPGTGWKEATT